MSRRNGRPPILTTRSVTETPAAALARLAAREAHPPSCTNARKGLIRPGDPGGPCVRETCGHPGCEAARRVALSRCVRCGLLIGYGIEVSAVRGGWAHEHCAMELQLAADERRGLRGHFTAGDHE